MVVKAFVPSINQSIESGIEEIRVQVTELLNDGFLNFGIGSETCQELPQRPEEMKITWCERQVVGRVIQNIPSETLFQIRCNRGRMWSSLVQQQGTFKKYSLSFPAICLVQPVECCTITGSFHSPSTRIEINQQQTLVAPKNCVYNFRRGWHCFELPMGRRGVSP
ncbi:hypothetical protein AVEN_47970-1 [Araneus ventricosus]|uniref:Uncharacterized protein n=1 Tax=Araneus ventricosus TaxID=182803 RepID=A0A4Y2DP72_ARAVE|nr:hypothetical protein AVEN_47970-1 [Araneus ventricosus]